MGPALPFALRHAGRVAAAVLLALAAACAGAPRPDPGLPTVEDADARPVEVFAALEFVRFGGPEAILRLAADAVTAEGWEVEPDSTAPDHLVTRPIHIPADAEFPARSALVMVSAMPRDDATLVRMEARSFGATHAVVAGDPRLLTALERLERRLHGRVGGGR